MKVGLLCGSQSERSSNAAILDHAGDHLEQLGHTTLRLPSVAGVPAFEPVSDDATPAVVTEFRGAIRSCDVLLIAAPEYAAGVAGSVKNALDWLVGDGTIYEKIVGVASAGTTGGPNAIEQLVKTISWQGGWVMATLSVPDVRTKTDSSGAFTDTATLEGIEQWVGRVAHASAASDDDRYRQLEEVLAPHGIDISRFGLTEPSQ